MGSIIRLRHLERDEAVGVAVEEVNYGAEA